MKKILLGSAFAFAALSLQSCFHDDKELFDDSAANRIEAVVEADQQLLESAANGWRMRYYTGQDFTGGGYTMFVKFKNGKAYVSSDIAPSDSVSSSSYAVIKDKGPVLTFNTLNGIMHFLAQPYQSDVDGEQGDYEFVIMRTTQDSIFVKGKKWHNSMVLTRVADDVNWKDQIDKMHDTFYSLKWYYKVSGTDDLYVNLDPATRRFYIGEGDNNGASFYVTTDGIAFREPLTINGKEVSSFRYDKASMSLISTESGVTLEAELPLGYHEIDDFVQSWNLKYYDSDNRKYTTTPFAMYNTNMLINQKSLSYLIATMAISSEYNLQMTAQYSPLTGTVTIPSQYIADPTGNFPVLMLMGVNSSTSYIYYTDWQVQENSATHQWEIVDPSGNADSIITLCCNNQGSPMYVKSDNTYTDDPDDPDIQSIAVMTIHWRVSTLISQ